MKHHSKALCAARKQARRIPFFPFLPLVPLAFMIANITLMTKLFRRLSRVEKRVYAF